MAEKIGRSSISFNKTVSIKETSSIVGPFEKDSPLKSHFDYISDDVLLGETTWEKAESRFMKKAVETVLKKADISTNKIDYMLSGDLLNQCESSTMTAKKYSIPFFGLFGACSTFGEALSLGSVLIDSGCGENIIAATSSHFCSAEKQFRFPLGLGTQRPPSTTRTVTGAGAVILSADRKFPLITGITTGRVIDYNVTDANNMGAAMAPAAAWLITQHLKDFNRKPNYYDRIVTGDLGKIGVEMLYLLAKEEGYNLDNIYDCGVEIYNNEDLDAHSGGSGCACSATVFCGYLFKLLKEKKLNRILFVPTGALMSADSVKQGEAISAIAHGVVIENEV